MHAKSETGLIHSYTHPPRTIINNLSADHHIKPHHAALLTLLSNTFTNSFKSAALSTKYKRYLTNSYPKL